jgi:hypothetical protein
MKKIKSKNQNIEETIEHPMDDSEIKKYLGENVKIIKFNDLSKYKSIEEILPKPLDYAIILFLHTPNSGHWTALSRYSTNPKNKNDKEHDVIEYFDSYGGKISNPLNWLSKEENEKLGITDDYLRNLLDKTDMTVIYNDIKFQKHDKNNPINTCGRFCCYRILQLLNGKTLPVFYEFLKKAKQENKMDYDELISHLIQI